MAKRKRIEEPPKVVLKQQTKRAKKGNGIHTTPPAKSIVADKTLSEKKEVNVSTTAKANAVRIIVGSYEKVLCGIDGRFNSTLTEVQSSKNPIEIKHKFDLKPVYMFSAHSGAIKYLAANERYLVSGGSDEVIKYYPIKPR
jgi:hypothetical protein